MWPEVLDQSKLWSVFCVVRSISKLPSPCATISKPAQHYYEMGTQLLSYSIPCFLPCYKCFPKHLFIPFAGSGAVFHHIDGSVEADRALFHGFKWGSLLMTGKYGDGSYNVFKHLARRQMLYMALWKKKEEKKHERHLVKFCWACTFFVRNDLLHCDTAVTATLWFDGHHFYWS